MTGSGSGSERPKNIRIHNPAYFLWFEHMSFLARSVSVPKSWFLHFYIFSSLYIPALLYLGRYNSSGPQRLSPVLMFPVRLDNSALYLHDLSGSFFRTPYSDTLPRTRPCTPSSVFVFSSVADPDPNLDPDPPDPHVFSQWYGSSGSFYNDAKIVRKTSNPTILTFYL
jgi:hypothetical protein